MLFRRRAETSSRQSAAGQAAAHSPWNGAPQLYSRNWAFIDPRVQDVLARQTIFAAGVGGASHIVTLACRTGFNRFIIADGDTVELSNLNRQAFGQRHIGKNKAVALAELLRDVRPDVQVEVIPEFLTERNYFDPLKPADVVINSIDFDQPAFLLLNRVAQAAGKTVLLPLNLGWGGSVLAFTPESETLDQYLGLHAGRSGSVDVAGELVQRVLGGLPYPIPPYLAGPLARFKDRGPDWPGDPQLGAGVYITATLAVGAAVARAMGIPIRVAPEVIHSDAMTAVTPLTGQTGPSTVDRVDGSDARTSVDSAAGAENPARSASVEAGAD